MQSKLKGSIQSWQNQETPPCISIIPVHTNIKAPKMGNGSHCSQTVQKVSASCTLVIRKIKITYQYKQRTRKSNSKNSTSQYTSIKTRPGTPRIRARSIDGKNSWESTKNPHKERAKNYQHTVYRGVSNTALISFPYGISRKRRLQKITFKIIISR